MKDRTADELFARFREKGEPDALAGVFDLTAPQILRVAVHLASDSAEAEDLLQATFVTALTSARSWDPSRPVVPWLLGILANHARKARSKRRPVPVERIEVPDPGPAPARSAAKSEVSREVRRAIDGLPEPYREALLLRLVHGLAPIEIAHLLQEPPPTVRSRIKRGLARLRKALPAGLSASALVALPPERGLAAVRSAVLSHVPLPAATGTALVTGGALAVKKTLMVTLFVLLLGAGGLIAIETLAPPGGSPPPAPETPPPSARIAPAEAPEERTAPLPLPVDFATVDRDRDVHGTVAFADGRPAAGARVAVTLPVWRQPHAGPGGERTEGPATRTAEDGSFRLRLPRGAVCDVDVELDGWPAGRLLRVQAGARLRLVIPDLVPLTVRTRDESGEPVAGARIRLSGVPWFDFGFTVEATAGEEGACRLAAVPAGRRLSLEAWREDLGSATVELEPLSGGGGSREVVIPAGLTVRGRVTAAATGEPVAGAEVYAAGRRKVVRTDAQGEYVYPGFMLPEKENHVRWLFVRAEGYPITVGGVRSGTLDFELLRGTTMTCRVVDGEGRPVEGARVSGAASAQGVTFEGRAESSGEARFELTGVPHSVPLTLVITAPGRGRVLYDVDSAPKPGGAVDLGDFVLPPAVALEGRVLDGSGAPIARAAVYLGGGNPDRADRRTATTPNYRPIHEGRRTDDLGRFRYLDLAPGDYELSVWLDDGRTRTVQVRLPATGGTVRTEVAFGRGAPLSVLVLDDRGEPVSGINVWTRTDAGAFRSTTGADGWALLFVEGRAAFVGVSDPSGRYVSPALDGARIPLGEGEREARLTVWPKGEVAGRVVGPDGEPMVASVRIALGGEWFPVLRLTDQEGRFRIPGPSRGAFDLHAAQGRFSGTLRGVAAGTGDLVVRLAERPRPPSDRTLRLLVLDPDGRPVPGVRIRIFGREGVTDGEGRLLLENLYAGTGNLQVRPSEVLTGLGLAPPRSTNVVPEGQEIVLRLRRTAPITGRVLLSDGAPAADARVDGYSHAGARFERFGPVRVRADGSFEIPVPKDLEAGIVLRAFLADAGGRVVQVERKGVRPGTANVEFRIHRPR